MGNVFCILLHQCICMICSQLIITLHTTHPLPRPADYIATGIYNNTVYLLGGSVSQRQLVEFNGTTFVDKGDDVLQWVKDYRNPPFAQIGYYIVWRDAVASSSVLHAYNMKDDTFTDNWAIMATNFNVDSRYVADEQRLFLVGGRINGGFFTNMVEIYNMITHQWSYGPTMNYKRTISGVVIDPITTHLYAIGGFGSNDTHDNVYLDSIEYMNITALDQWSFVPGILPTGVSDTTAVLYKQLIYIIGSGKNAQHAIYTLDPANNVIDSMDGYLPYRIFNAVVFKDVLYA
eukprot:779432_1